MYFPFHANKSLHLVSPFNNLMHVMIYKMFAFRQKLSRGESGNEPPLIGAVKRRGKVRESRPFSSYPIHFPIELNSSKSVCSIEEIFLEPSVPSSLIARFCFVLRSLLLFFCNCKPRCSSV